MHVKYLGAAQFDDLLLLTTRVTRTRGTRIDHDYRIVLPTGRADVPIVEGTSVVACIDRSGAVRPLLERAEQVARDLFGAFQDSEDIFGHDLVDILLAVTPIQ